MAGVARARNPPSGRECNTLFANQYAAYDAFSEAMKARLAGLQAVHWARRGYSPEGMYGERDRCHSMAIRYSERATAMRLHPVVRRHPETGGYRGIAGCCGELRLENRAAKRSLRQALAFRCQRERDDEQAEYEGVHAIQGPTGTPPRIRSPVSAKACCGTGKRGSPRHSRCSSVLRCFDCCSFAYCILYENGEDKLRLRQSAARAGA
jgi:Taurine catabolism dioxygenase TauD, TfdA family